MPIEPINVLFGAGVALVAREAVDARKAKQQRHAHGDAVVRAVQEELVDVRKVVRDNIWKLWAPVPGRTLQRHRSFGDSRDPLHPLPLRIDGLLRSEGPDDLLTNRQARRLLSRIVTATTYINVLEGERMRFIAAQDPDRLAWALVSKEHDTLASALDRKDRHLHGLSVELFALVLTAQAVVNVIAAERRRWRKLRSRIGGSYYVPAASDRLFLQKLVDADEQGTFDKPGTLSAFNRFPMSFEDAEGAVATLVHLGLARENDGKWSLTAQGRVLAGSGAEVWHDLASPDPPEEVFDWKMLDADN